MGINKAFSCTGEWTHPQLLNLSNLSNFFCCIDNESYCEWTHPITDGRMRAACVLVSSFTLMPFFSRSCKIPQKDKNTSKKENCKDLVLCNLIVNTKQIQMRSRTRGRWRGGSGSM